jgi:ketosteroid isomerase-like protein
MRDDRAFLVWEEALRFVRERDLDGYAETFAPDGVVELPFPLPGMPRRIEGRQEIRRVLAPVWRAAKESGRRIEGWDPVTVHPTDDPEVVVIEFELKGVEASGTPYRMSYVHVVTVRDGHIAVMRDYVDTHPIAERVRAAGEDRNKAVVRRYYAMISGDGHGGDDLDRLDRVLADGYVHHGHPESTGPAAALAAKRRFLAENRGARITVDTLVAEGDLVSARTTVRRTIDGEALVASGMAFFRVKEGKIAEQWSCYPRKG